MKCQNCGAEIQNQSKFCPYCGQKNEYSAGVQVSNADSFRHDVSAVWPEWHIEKLIGEGSYGLVYQAVRTDNGVENHAAIKVVSIPSSKSEIDSLYSEGFNQETATTFFKEQVNDFVNEIKIMNSLKGVQNIVSVEDYKVVEKTNSIGWDIYIRMELLTPFNTYICNNNLTEKDVIKLGIDICSALEICSQREIIHRDIKPENIFVNDFGHFKLGDFGIARKLENMTGGLSQKGTFNYMAPEVANSSEYDARVDTYSLGIVLYRLLNNNKLPFLETDKQLLNPNERKLAVERRIRGEALPAPLNASPAMANLILRACAHNPNARFDSAAEMKQALVSIGNGTYQMLSDDLDKTVLVRSVQKNFDTTVSVRKTPKKDKSSSSQVDTFGAYPDRQAKAKQLLLTVGVVVLSVLIASGALWFAIKSEFGLESSDSSTSEESSQTSAASETIIMPNCINKHYKEIVENLEESGLVVKLKYQFSDSVLAESVISQSIKAGTEVTDGSTVTIVVSKGSDVCPFEYSQKVTVTAKKGSSDAQLSLYDWVNGEWQLKFTCYAKVGKKGISANYGEGISATPLGTYKLGVVLTASEINNTSWPVKKVTKNTCIVDDSTSAYYNTIQQIASLPSGTHYDPIGKAITQGYSKACLYIEHNGNGISTSNVVKGKGSGITICGVKSSLTATAGCIDIASSDFDMLISILDYNKNPYIETTIG